MPSYSRPGISACPGPKSVATVTINPAGARNGSTGVYPGVEQTPGQRFLELDPELPNRDFPAWVLIDQPGLASWLATERCFDDVEVPEDYLATAGLVQEKSSLLVDAGLMDMNVYTFRKGRNHAGRTTPGLPITRYAC